jgi:arabinose-5-phosphate isomerase
MAAVAMMDEFNLNSLPVVDKNNQVVGAINTHTLMQAKITNTIYFSQKLSLFR